MPSKPPRTTTKPSKWMRDEDVEETRMYLHAEQKWEDMHPSARNRARREAAERAFLKARQRQKIAERRAK